MFLIEQVNAKMARYMRDRRLAGKTSFAYCGGRRSGKTYFIAQFLLTRVYTGEIVNVASMTQTQGRLGAYSDFKAIIDDCPTLSALLECMTCPLEIRNNANNGRVYFNSYQNSETAKGIACDWLFLNEANNFTKQQLADLRANVRKGWLCDFNPNCHFWVDDYFADDEVCHSTWQDNPFLTAAQKEYFAELKQNAIREGASALDMWLYRVYYLGEYAELAGAIFTTENIRVGAIPTGLMHHVIFCDPSALRGSDYFACVLCGTDGVNMYVIDTYSVNVGSFDGVIDHLQGWCSRWNVERLIVETNGVGEFFVDELRKREVAYCPWHSSAKKFDRIVANYQDITQHVVFGDSGQNRLYLQQIYAFDTRCEHDDNIDAVNNALLYYKYSRLM